MIMGSRHLNGLGRKQAVGSSPTPEILLSVGDRVTGRAATALWTGIDLETHQKAKDIHCDPE